MIFQNFRSTKSLYKKISVTYLAIFVFFSTEGISVTKRNQIEKPLIDPVTGALIMWCAKTDNNTHIGHCFVKQKKCKEYSLKKFEENGGKLFLCRPTRL
tara:strand:+ start:509 stop:805 length:297 start_codon:yes stop_codon:yes gene_type:complete